MQSQATTVAEYLAQLPEERREPMTKIYKLVRKHLPKGYEEGMQYGMIGWYVPLAKYPDTYNKQPLGIIGLASQKQYMSLYLSGVYSNPDVESWFLDEWKKSGKKLDMGKSCLRFKKLDDLALDVVGEVVARITPDDLIARYEEVKGLTAKKPSARAVRGAKPASRKTSAGQS